MGNNINIVIDNSDVLDGLQKVLAVMLDPTPVLQDISVTMLEDTFQHFRREEGPNGKKWKRSMRAKLAKRGGTTLRDNSYLINSIVQGRGITKKSAFLQTDKIYAPIHQFGGVITAKNKKFLKFRLPGAKKDTFVKSVTIPARPFFWISKPAGDAMVKRMSEAIGEAWANK